jgi:hypothetical protein
MAVTLHRFGWLPYELRHQIWESHLPKLNQTRGHIRALAEHILALPRDTFWSRPNRQDGDWILKIKKQARSPYQELSSCHESRILVLKQVKKALENDPVLKKWINKPPFPFHPKLILDLKAGALIYSCPKITEGYHLEQLVFWEYTAPTLTSTRQPWQMSEEEDEAEAEDEWDPESVLIEELDNGLIWSDDESSKQDRLLPTSPLRKLLISTSPKVRTKPTCKSST